MVNIDAVEFGEVKINGKIYYSDMIIWWDGERDFRLKSNIIDINDLAVLLQKKPEAVIIGTGIIGSLKILPEVEMSLEMKKISLFVDKSPNAADIFNGFMSQGKKAVALIHTTG
ncbi:MAG: MTH938/NDUFAF3 family protein [Candidatus Aenigmatarchaeota archaeon]